MLGEEISLQFLHGHLDVHEIFAYFVCISLFNFFCQSELFLWPHQSHATFDEIFASKLEQVEILS